MRDRMTVCMARIAFALALVGCQANSANKGRHDPPGVSLALASSNRTSYTIVMPDAPTEVDVYAVKELSAFMKQKTGATFPVLSPGQVTRANRCVFVGVSDAAVKTLGKDPLATLADQEHVARSVGNDIFLYGKGIHGNFHAVLDFMEGVLGRRWYTRSDEPVIPMQRELVVKPFDRKSGFSFAYRLDVERECLFAYHQGLNMGFAELNARHKAGANEDLFPPGVVSFALVQPWVHSSFDYIPPTPPQARRLFEWITNRNYFASNPEFFSMDSSGKRSPRQLCFSNAKLRMELTTNIREHARRLSGDVVPLYLYHGTNSIAHARRVGEKVILTLDADDSGVQFCACPGCKRLEDKYGSPAGPIFDYLFELCALLKAEYPDVRVKTLAYRRSQTQKPPVLPPGMTFPDNLIVWFANVEDNLNVDWNHPLNRSTYDDLLAWRKLTPHLWTWYYPDLYGGSGPLPFVNIDRLVTDIRLMQKAGVEGVYYEFDTHIVATASTFSELQVYLYYQLARDVDVDVPALIREFTDHQYGAAAPRVRTYLHELEAGGKALETPMPLTPRSLDFKGCFAYLTPANLRRWQVLFDDMERDAARDERCLENVRRLRRTLDFATLARWHELAGIAPDYFRDYRLYKERLGPLAKRFATAIADAETIIKAGGKAKPLPPLFDGIEAPRIHRFVPNRIVYRDEPKTVLDPEAAFGYASIVDAPDLPFHFGFYQNDRPAKAPGALRQRPVDPGLKWVKTKNGHWAPQRELKAGDIKPGAYQVYKLEEIEVTPDCMVWFSSQSWNTCLTVGNRLYAPGEDNRYEVYVSLKFAGPAYGGKEDKDLVLCDQIIFVRAKP